MVKMNDKKFERSVSDVCAYCGKPIIDEFFCVVVGVQSAVDICPDCKVMYNCVVMSRYQKGFGEWFYNDMHGR